MSIGLIGLLLAGSLLVWRTQIVRYEVGQRVCGWIGGKWGSAQGVCVTRSCYAQGNCGYWAYPSARCAYLKPGDPIEEVYFQLGNPAQIDGSEYTWIGKAGLVGFTAFIENRKLKSINCR